ncbi:MAG: hypothetical protein IT428_23510 [Planctomycetaceae bacterium]|nr:hypothetical protein [Planctomycetaceae bacterium]
MNSEHRHELKENELGKLTVKAQSFFEKYGNQVLLGTIGALLLAGGIALWVNSSTSKAAAGWNRFVGAETASDYATVADAFPGTEVAQWAKLNEAENYLFNGLQLTFKDRKSGKSDLEKGKALFEDVLKSTPLPPRMRERALFGLARTLEITSGKDTSEAIKTYDAIVTDFKDSTYGRLAAERVDALKKGGTQSFYAWFQEQNPKLDDRPKPKDGGLPFELPSAHPPLDFDALGKKEESKSEETKDEPKDLPKEPAPGTESEKKEEGEKKPAADKPEADKKPEEPKSDEKKPE